MVLRVRSILQRHEAQVAGRRGASLSLCSGTHSWRIHLIPWFFIMSVELLQRRIDELLAVMGIFGQEAVLQVPVFSVYLIHKKQSRLS